MNCRKAAGLLGRRHANVPPSPQQAFFFSCPPRGRGSGARGSRWGDSCTANPNPEFATVSGVAVRLPPNACRLYRRGLFSSPGVSRLVVTHESMNGYGERCLPIMPFSLAQAFTPRCYTLVDERIRRAMPSHHALFSSPGVYAWERELSLIFLFSPFRGGAGNGIRNHQQWPLKGADRKEK